MARRLAFVLGGALAAASAFVMLAGQGNVVPVVAQPAAVSAALSAPTHVKETTKDSVSSFPLAPTAADMQRVAAYWSPERLKQASSYVPSAKPSRAPGATTSSVEVRRAAEALAAPAAASTGAAPPMVGKVFFKVGAKEYWCSASVVHSARRNLVATAGHCAYSLTEDKPVENWIFIPSYQDGKTDGGIFVGHTLFMHEDFAGRGDFDRDYAFVTVHRGFTWQPYVQNGTVKYRSIDVGRLEDRVGAFVFSSATPTGRPVTAFGYPAGANPDGSRPYNGQVVKMCGGTTEKKPVSAPTWQVERGVRLPGCGFTSGASGGPWVTGYDAVRRTGRLIGITSLTWNVNGDGRLDAISAPYFNSLTRRVYLQAAGQATD